MFLQPKKTKYKKVSKGSLKRLEHKSNHLKHGEMGIKTIKSGMISARQIETARRAIVKKINRKGKIWLCVYPHLPVTTKPIESRMGKGKGAVSFWACKVGAGTTLFEICGVSKSTASEALLAGGKKLPVKTKIFD